MELKLFFAFFILCQPLYMLCQVQNWQIYTNKNNVNSLQENHNFVWAGTNGGLIRINKHTNNISFFETTNSGLSCGWITTLELSKTDRLWIGTENFGIDVFDGETWKH